jgi:hypothetical protein
MRHLILYVVTTVCLFSCKSISNPLELEAQKESWKSGEKSIQLWNFYLLMEMHNKMTDPATSFRAQHYYTPMLTVDSLCKDAADSLSKWTDQKLALNDGEQLMPFFVRLESKLKMVHPVIERWMVKVDFITGTSVPDTGVLIDMKDYLNKLSQDRYSVFFAQLHHNILLYDNRILALLSEQVPRYNDHYYSFSAIVGQSSNVLAPGEFIEINAGMGRFDRQKNPAIMINGKKVELEEDLQAKLKIRVSEKPGQYSIPVTIEFTDQDGIKQTVAKEVTYKVTSCGN